MANSISFFKEIIEGYSEPFYKRAEADYEHKLQYVQRSMKKAKEELMEISCGHTDKSQTAVYMQNNRQAFVALANTLTDHLSIEDAKTVYDDTNCNSYVGLIKGMYRCIEQVLDYMMLHFGEHLTANCIPPQIYRMAMMGKLEQKMKQLCEDLNALGVNKTLLEIAIEPIRNFLCGKDKRNTHQYLQYLDEYTDALAALCQEDHTEHRKGINTRMAETLFYMNFNTRGFLNYYTNTIGKKLSAIGDVEEQMGYLKKVLKGNNGKRIRKDIVYRQERGNVRTVIAEWLEDELHYLQATHKPSGKKALDGTEYRLQLGITVPVLGFLIRVFTDLKIFRPVVKMDMYRMFARNVSSVRSEEVSPESVKKKAEKPDPVTVETVLALLQSMIDYIKKHFC